MLRLVAAQSETLWDEALPIEVRELPEDLAALDGVLCDPRLLATVCGALGTRGAVVGGVGGRSWASDPRDRRKKFRRLGSRALASEGISALHLRTVTDALVPARLRRAADGLHRQRIKTQSGRSDGYEVTVPLAPGTQKPGAREVRSRS